MLGTPQHQQKRVVSEVLTRTTTTCENTCQADHPADLGPVYGVEIQYRRVQVPDPQSSLLIRRAD